MAKKKSSNTSGGLVYSTHSLPEMDTNEQSDAIETPDPSKQDLRVTLDRKLKGGKVATIIYQFVGSEDALSELGKKLRQSCSVGGSAKDGEVILQGDCRDKVCTFLDKWGYKYKRAGG